jgi:signal transduction histidine kinase
MTEYSERAEFPKGLRPKELEAVYAISRTIGSAVDIETALDQIAYITRPVLIFDTLVLYLPKKERGLEPTYARVIGRGRSAEGELAWGETTAWQAYQLQHTYMHQEKLDRWQQDRLFWRDFLGMPLKSSQEVMGAVVFCRYGGPPFTSDQVRLAEFISVHIAQLLEHQKLVNQIATLQAERRLRKLQDDFIATVSHELCTPLGFIKGYATTLLREDIDWDASNRREFLAIIDEEADRLRSLIDNLLDSSRLQAGTLRIQPQPVRVDRLLREVIQKSTSLYEHLEIRLDTQTEIIVQADPVRLAQVFDNLISNAVKYAPGSPVHIKIQALDSWLQIAISDQGPGIPIDHQAQLFQRFYRVPETSAAVHGTGLGLFICREIIRTHQGEIRVESTPGQGTTFLIELPLTTKSPEAKTIL